jgi:hypothetical protein
MSEFMLFTVCMLIFMSLTAFVERLQARIDAVGVAKENEHPIAEISKPSSTQDGQLSLAQGNGGELDMVDGHVGGLSEAMSQVQIRDALLTELIKLTQREQHSRNEYRRLTRALNIYRFDDGEYHWVWAENETMARMCLDSSIGYMADVEYSDEVYQLTPDEVVEFSSIDALTRQSVPCAFQVARCGAIWLYICSSSW